MGISLSRSNSSTGAALPSGLLIISGLIVFSPLLDGGTTHLAVMVVRLLILLLWGLYLWSAVSEKTLRIPEIPFTKPLLLFLTLACLNVAVSPYSHQSLQWLVVLCSYALLLYLVVFFVKDWEHIIRFLQLIVGLGLFEAIAAIVQNRLGQVRPPGTFYNPNFLAGFLACAWTIGLGYLCYTGFGKRIYHGVRANKRRAPVVWATASVLLILLVAIVLTGSRGGLLALSSGTGIVLANRYWKNKSALGGAATLVVGISALVYWLWPNHGLVQVEYARWQIWVSSVRAMFEHPLGAGLGLYQYIYPSYAVPLEGVISRYGRVAHSAHNEYLQIGVELGIAGLATFIWGVGLFARELARWIAQRMSRWQRGVVVGMAGAVAGILLQAMVDSNLHEPAIAILLIVLVGGLISLRYQNDLVSSVAFQRAVRSPFLWKTISLVVIGLLTANIARWGVAWTAYAAGMQARESGDHEQAITQFGKSIRFDPGKALYHSALGGTYFEEFGRRPDTSSANKALAELHAAIALNPVDGRLYVVLGRVYGAVASSLSNLPAQDSERESLLRAAVASYQRSLALEPFIASSHLELGRLHWLLGDRSKAEAIVQQAVSLEPNFLPAREWLAHVYLETHRWGQAKHEYEEILARQGRYAYRSKDALETTFLTADAGGIAALLAQKASDT